MAEDKHGVYLNLWGAPYKCVSGFVSNLYQSKKYKIYTADPTIILGTYNIKFFSQSCQLRVSLDNGDGLVREPLEWMPAPINALIDMRKEVLFQVLCGLKLGTEFSKGNT